MKPYFEDKCDLVNNSEKVEVKIRMLFIYFPFCLPPIVNAMYEKR